MLKQLSCLALLCFAASLSAMKPSAAPVSGAAPKAANFNELAIDQRQNILNLDEAIEDYLGAHERDVQLTYGRIVNALARRVLVETPAPLILRGKNATLSIIAKVQALIEENKEALEPYTVGGREERALDLVTQRARLNEVKSLLDAHLLAHTERPAAKSDAKPEERPDRSGPHRGQPTKGGFFSGIKKHHVLGTLVFVGLGYAVWRKFLTTSEEDEK